jgi:hypothetical protein
MLKRLRSDHGREFDKLFKAFCVENGIQQEFSTLKPPQQNGVFERKNMTKEEMARVMLNAKKISQRWWVKVVNTTMYIINKTYFKPHANKTACEIWNGKKL